MTFISGYSMSVSSSESFIKYVDVKKWPCDSPRFNPPMYEAEEYFSLRDIGCRPWMRTVTCFVWPITVSGGTKHIFEDAQADENQLQLNQYSKDAILHENGQYSGMVGGLCEPPTTTTQCNGW